jgi:two-component system, response regulator PdtaR
MSGQSQGGAAPPRGSRRVRRSVGARTGTRYPPPGMVASPDRETASGSGRAAPLVVRPRVLVVEDDAIIAFDIEDTLSQLGFEVVGTAMSAEEAVNLAEALRPDCLTMDIRIRGPRDGVSAAIEIYERFGIRSVFVSAFAGSAEAERAAAARPLGWVGKPISREALRSALMGLDGPRE